jgi:hypothetical protein
MEGLAECSRTRPRERATLSSVHAGGTSGAGSQPLYYPAPRPLTGNQGRQVSAGYHQLLIVALRNSDVPRAQRLCMESDRKALGDEQHLLF